jgi:mono/diheme cytochrome c family protein
MSAKINFFITTVFTLVIFTSIPANSSELSKGKYLIEIGGCNDCHTSGYAPSGGTTPEEEWLLGDGLGFRGAWGTTYAVNIREYTGEISESEWVTKAKTLKTRPPMPWWILNAMTESDLRAIYKYVNSLGIIKKDVPSYVPPGEEPKTPYIQWPLAPE